MWVIDQLKSSHDRTRFSCGEIILDQWLRQRATQWTKKGFARVYVATSGAESNEVAGYYAISNHYVTHSDLARPQAKGLPPEIDVPTVLLGRLAIDRKFQGQGLGRFLLFDALSRCLAIADKIGIAAVEVDAISEGARQFYLASGFHPLQDDTRHLFVSIKQLRALGLPSGSES